MDLKGKVHSCRSKITPQMVVLPWIDVGAAHYAREADSLLADVGVPVVRREEKSLRLLYGPSR